jgi:hypothetical protein
MTVHSPVVYMRNNRPKLGSIVFLNQSEYNSLPKNWKRRVFPTKNVVHGMNLLPSNKYVYVPFEPFGIYKSPIGRTVGARNNQISNIVNKATKLKTNSARTLIQRSVKNYLYSPARMNWIKKQRKSNMWRN